MHFSPRCLKVTKNCVLFMHYLIRVILCEMPFGMPYPAIKNYSNKDWTLALYTLKTIVTKFLEIPWKKLQKWLKVRNRYCNLKKNSWPSTKIFQNLLLKNCLRNKRSLYSHRSRKSYFNKVISILKEITNKAIEIIKVIITDADLTT